MADIPSLISEGRRLIEEATKGRSRLSRSVPAVERFGAQVIPEPMSGCHLWIGPTSGKGYGVLVVNGRRTKAHRFAWELARGPVPANHMVLHRCDNPPCVNTAHLFLGTNSDNQLDAVRKGRHYGSRKRTCKRAGHPLSGNNVRVSERGWRRCLACQRESVVRWYKRAKQNPDELRAKWAIANHKRAAAYRQRRNASTPPCAGR